MHKMLDTCACFFKEKQPSSRWSSSIRSVLVLEAPKSVLGRNRPLCPLQSEEKLVTSGEPEI